MTDDKMDELARIMCIRAELLILVGQRVKAKALLGGAFGHGGYYIASYAHVEKQLDVVSYMVVHGDTFSPIGSGRTQEEALSDAREVLAALDKAVLHEMFRRVKARVEIICEQERIAAEAQRVAMMKDSEKIAPPRRIPKRRQAIFDKSEGKCHYCETPLILDGKWHIEHKMPRALMGGSETSNLVASCVSCNMKKKDRTDLEFMAAREGAA